MSPLVSIVIPVYNVEEYLKECIDSVLNQTYKNIEIIAINDGSSDNSLAILEDYNSKYNQIFITSQENSGLSATRNKGIELANGKYILFLDSDDYILPNTLSNLVSSMEKNNLDLVRFSAEPFVDGTYPLRLNKSQYDFSAYFDDGKIYDKQNFIKQSIKGYSSSACLYIVKRDILLDRHIRFKNNILHEDELFTVELLLNINSAMYDRISYYKRRFRSNSIMTTADKSKQKKSFDSYCIVIKELQKLLKEYREPIEQKLIKNRCRLLTVGLIYKNIDESYKKEKIREIDPINKFEVEYHKVRYRIKKLLGM